MGQRAVRFYDPDGHIVEVGENMKCVVERFIAKDMTTMAQVAERMGIAEEYVKTILEAKI